MAKANRKIRMRDDDEAIVGVGTLIVFIAMILVAAITAGVIIKTEYALKNKAETTANAATAEATGGPKIVDIVGDRGNPLLGAPCVGCVQTIQFSITTWEGSDAINFQYMRIHWVGPSKEIFLSLRMANPSNPDPTHYGADETPADANNGWDLATARYYLDDNNVIVVKIDLTNPAGGGNGINDLLPANSHATVTFIPAHGPQVTEEFVTPSDYGAIRWLDLTNT
jgi:flagellin-like protein